MTEEGRRAVSWVTRPGTRDPDNEEACSAELYADFVEANGKDGVDWAVDEWKEACEHWRQEFRFRSVGIDEADENAKFCVWAHGHDGEQIEPEFFSDFREAHGRWKQLWNTPR